MPICPSSFFASARMSVPAAILAVTVVEWLATGRGLGHLMTLSASLSNYGMLWLTVVLVTACGLTAIVALFVDWLAGVAEDVLRPRGL